MCSKGEVNDVSISNSSWPCTLDGCRPRSPSRAPLVSKGLMDAGHRRGTDRVNKPCRFCWLVGNLRPAEAHSRQLEPLTELEEIEK